MSHQSPNTTKILHSLLSIAKKAGTLILTTTSHTNTSSNVSTKKNTVDLVTETDKAVELLISTTLLSEYPGYAFMGEETYTPGTPLTKEPTFVVDPIDGTTNFVHGYGYVSVSLGFCVGGIPVVGVVFNPFTGVCYWGVKGEGGWREQWEVSSSGGEGEGWKVKGEKVRLPVGNGGQPKSMAGLDGALVAVEWGSDRSDKLWKTKVDTWRRLGASKDEGGAMIHGARSFGSAALNLCAVAEGSIDIYWEGGCWAWDVCAGWVVLKEAGGVIVDGNPPVDGTEGWDIPITHRKYLAVRGVEEGEQRQKEIVREFWGMIEGRMEYEH